MKLISLILPFAVVCLSLHFATGQTDCSNDRLDDCGRNLMRFTKEDVKVPSTEAEVIENCDAIKNGSRCIRNYFNKCSPSIVKQMTKVAMVGVSRTINKNCSPAGIKEVLTHRECISSVKSNIRACYTELVKDAYRIKESSKEKWHPLTCCFISKFHECVTDTITKTCKEESREYYIKEATKLMDELMEMFCPDNYRWGTSDCTEVATNLPEPTMPTDRAPTILPLLIDMMKQFAEA